VLLCEGNMGGPDARVLNRILAGRGEIKPLGGKYGMRERVKARREAMPQSTVYGLLDGDFPRVWAPPVGRPKPWDADGTQLGWRWERKEIENYLLDPQVVRRALGAVAPDGGRYQAALERARDQICTYQAARLALTIHRPRFQPLANEFGRERGRLRHIMPDDFSVAACEAGIQQAVSDHNAGQTVALQTVATEFRSRCPECAVGGQRFSTYLVAFAGKDLLHAMSEDLRAMGFASPAVFIEKVLQGLENTPDDVASWLAEWTALRQAVETLALR